MTRPIFAAVAVTLLAACTPASSASTQGGRATLRPVCAPNDAPAVMLQVPASPREQYPYFRLRVEEPLGQLVGRHIVVRDPDAAGPSAEWCTADGCRVIRSATPTSVGFEKMERDSSMLVRVRNSRPDGKIFFWLGWVRWQGETLVCG